jgi:hypothetical protein
MAHCLTTTQMAGQLGLTSEVCDPLRQVFTRWDAKGVPDGVGGEQIARPVRLFHLVDTVEVFHRAGGVEAAVKVALARRTPRSLECCSQGQPGPTHQEARPCQARPSSA